MKLVATLVSLGEPTKIGLLALGLDASVTWPFTGETGDDEGPGFFTAFAANLSFLVYMATPLIGSSRLPFKKFWASFATLKACTTAPSCLILGAPYASVLDVYYVCPGRLS